MIIKLLLAILALVSAPIVDNDIEHAAKTHKNGWISYQVPAAPETPSMCCWKGDGIKACDLNSTETGFGSTSSAPKTDTIHVYVKLKNAAPEVVMPVGDHCEVKTQGVVLNDLGTVAPQASIAWLKHLAISQKQGEVENGSLYALSLHDAPEVTSSLSELAELNRPGLSPQAVFWLGNRKADAVKPLNRLLNTLPKGETRRHINMALQHNGSDKALELLQQIAKDDKDNEQQRDAIFWLGQSDQIEAQVLLDMIANPESNDLHEALVFSLSQHENGSDQLFKIIQGDYSKAVKKQAVFWLAQSDDEAVQNRLMELL